MEASLWVPWVSAIVIALILGITIIAAVGAKNGIKAEVRKEEIAAMSKFSASANDLSGRLDSLDERLARIEKMLNDIP